VSRCDKQQCATQVARKLSLHVHGTLQIDDFIPGRTALESCGRRVIVRVSFGDPYDHDGLVVSK